MRRRGFVILGLGALAAPFAALAQPGRVLRIAILDAATESAQRHHWRAFTRRLAELGYVEGKNLKVEQRFARGATDRLPALAAELVALKPDVIVALGTNVARAVKQATASIPIVFLGTADPVRDGLAASLARPGGNATGISNISLELGLKWIELLREISPGSKRFAFIGDATNIGARRNFDTLQAQARALGVTVELFDGGRRDALERSLEAIVHGRYEGAYTGNSPTILDHRDRILQFAARQKLPVVYPRREYVDAGGLVYYGVDLGAVYPRAAEYVHRIAQGARPSEMPIEEPSTVRMVVNLKAARAQGIKIPQRLLVRADEVIE